MIFSFNRLSKPLLLVTCCQLCTIVNATNAPISDTHREQHILSVGQLFSLIIAPSRGDGLASELVADGLPLSAVLLKNLDGTKTLMWVPEEGDLGHSEVTLSFVDDKQPELVEEKILELVVADESEYLLLKETLEAQNRLQELSSIETSFDNQQPIDQPSEISNAVEPPSTSDKSKPLPMTDVMRKQNNESIVVEQSKNESTGHDALSRKTIQTQTSAPEPPDPDFLDPDIKDPDFADPDTVITPIENVTNNDHEFSETEINKLALLEPGLVENEPTQLVEELAEEQVKAEESPTPDEIPQTMQSMTKNDAEGSEVKSAQIENETLASPPEIQIASEFSITQGVAFTTEIGVIADPSRNFSLEAFNLPKHASLVQTNAGTYSLNWQPDYQDIGVTAIVLRLTTDDPNAKVLTKRVRFIVGF